jgi:hypothetical protein
MAPLYKNTTAPLEVSEAVALAMRSAPVEPERHFLSPLRFTAKLTLA